jgi:hypothetical protein
MVGSYINEVSASTFHLGSTDMRYYDYSDSFGPAELLNSAALDLPIDDTKSQGKTHRVAGGLLVALLYVFGLGALGWGTMKVAESSVVLNQHALSSSFVVLH